MYKLCQIKLNDHFLISIRSLVFLFQAEDEGQCYIPKKPMLVTAVCRVNGGVGGQK